MALVLKRACQTFSWINEFHDPRSDDLPFMKSPWILSLIIATYLCFVIKVGPNFMKNRQPLNIKGILIAYNILQVVLNFYCTYIAFKKILAISWRCAPIDFSNTPEGREELHILRWYFSLKGLDLFDTVFFVLRKSYRQITFLHKYHHAGILVVAFVGVRYCPGGQSIWVVLLNCFVHIVMYAYYLLTVVDDKWKTNVTLKKLLTQIQIMQFLIMIIAFGGAIITPNCTYPKIIAYLFLQQIVFMITLFGDFYIKSYIKKK